MNRLFFFVLLLPLLPLQAASLAVAERVVSVTVRPGVTEAYLLVKPAKPVASAIVFAGYSGYLNITRDGIQQPSRNFLVRTRQLFAACGIAVAVVDVPSDHRGVLGMLDWRATETHARDIGKIIDDVQRRTGRPVWLIGTSRGTISVVNAGARLYNRHLAGLVLMSTVTIPGGSNSGTVYDAPIKNIRVPVLIVHHEDDDCFVSTLRGARRLIKKLGNTSIVNFIVVTGGNKPESSSCGPLSEHGFYGIEANVVDRISSWIKRLAH